MPNFQPIEKLVPQPQEAVAFGFSTRKLWPMRSSTKSRVEPSRKGREVGSIRTIAPSRSMRISSSALAVSTAKLYWKPEQPPPLTLTRNFASDGSDAKIDLMRFAARSVTEKLWLGLASIAKGLFLIQRLFLTQNRGSEG